VRILTFQFVPDLRGRPVPRFEPRLGVLLSLLRQRGHDVSLLGLARFDLPAVKEVLARALPQLIYADISPVCLDAARRTLEFIARHEHRPIVAGGDLPSIEPELALSLPGVQAAAIGEPDASLVTYFERMKDPAIRQVVQGIWLRDERGLARPELPALVEDLDSLPFAERDLFEYERFVQQTGRIEIAVGRGCPQSCGYCLLPTIAEMYRGRGTWVRKRSPANVLDEIDHLRRRYEGVRTVRFLDHAFALDPEWLDEFLSLYAQRCDLPFECHLRANATDAGQIGRLARAGCRAASVEVISASDFVRNEIFAMQLSEQQIIDAFARLRRAGIRSRAIVYLGCPYESEASLEGMGDLLRRLRPDAVDVRPYFPFPGTRGRQVARENGWLHPRDQEQYHRDRCGLDMPACRAAQVEAFVRRLRHEWSVRLGEPWWRRVSAGPRGWLERLGRAPRRH